MAISKIIIVGAGPSGLLLGILLVKQGIKVQLLEMSSVLDLNPRAAHYAATAVQEFRRAEVYDDVAKDAFKPEGVCWRDQDGKLLAGIRSDKNSPDAMICLPLDRLDQILLRHFLERGGEILWEHKVVGIDQDENEAQVRVETKEGIKNFAADYVLGCDGANSTVRKSLFGESYPGETLQSQIIATNVYYDFDKKFNYWDAQFIVHPTDWYMAAKITEDGMWRVTYGDTFGLSNEEYIKRQPMRYEKILPGNPKPGDYRLANVSPYKLHQRCAENFRVGRVLLVADAAHLCNPFGGMGLTGGFADVTCLYDCLLALHQGLTDDSILAAYSDVRRKKWAEIIDPISRGNFSRIWDEKCIDDRLNFFEMCKKMETDKELSKKSAQFLYTLNEDMRPYFKKPLAQMSGANGN